MCRGGGAGSAECEKMVVKGAVRGSYTLFYAIDDADGRGQMYIGGVCSSLYYTYSFR